MSNNKHRIRDQRLGGMAGDGFPLSDVQRIAIANTTRADHDINTGAAVKYGSAAVRGDERPIHLHQGEVPASEIAARLEGHPTKEAEKDTR
jgi:hypothetical protein